MTLTRVWIGKSHCPPGVIKQILYNKYKYSTVCKIERVHKYKQKNKDIIKKKQDLNETEEQI